MGNVTLSPHLGYVHHDNYRIFYADTVENVAACSPESRSGFSNRTEK